METILDYLPVAGAVVAAGLLALTIRESLRSRSEERRRRRKASVLENASVFVHSISPAERPSYVRADREEPEERRYYNVDVTITPAPAPMGSGTAPGPARWAPFELDTTDPDSDPDAVEEPCELYAVEVWWGGRFVDDDDLPVEEWEVEGPRRVRLLVGAFPSARRLMLLYHVQEVGEVRLP